MNLGQGFPNWSPPDFVVSAMVESVTTDGPSTNQYCRPEAHLPLAVALAADYNAKWHDLNPSLPQIDPLTMVVTSVGCTKAMYIAIMSLIDRTSSDEAILIEPAFDIYAEQVKLAGGTNRFVPMKTLLPGTCADQVFQLDWSALALALNDKTRILVLNTPHNPTGKMFSRDEQLRLADLLRPYPRVVVLADEVYEHITYGPNTHVSFASLSSETFGKTLTLSSSGKTFTTTGWKVGWCVGPAELISRLASLQQWTTFSCPTITQDAIARCLATARLPRNGFANFYDELKDMYSKKRDVLASALREGGLNPILPAGGFFICADTTAVVPPPQVYEEESVACSSRPMTRDWAIARHFTQRGGKGVAVIPPSAFYCSENKKLAENYVRFAFCKTDDLLLEAAERLKSWNK